MPLYDYQCEGCGNIATEYRIIARREESSLCHSCNSPMRYIFSIPGKRYDHLYPYTDEYIAPKPLTINSRSHYLKELKERGIVEKSRGRGMKGQWV